MANLMKMPDVWRVLKEVDLEAIRRDASSRFRLVVVAEEAAHAERLSALLAGDGGHPWIEVAAQGAPVAEPSTVTLALLLSPGGELPPVVAAAGRGLRAAGVPVLAVVHGPRRATDAVTRDAESARVAVEDLDDEALDAIAEEVVERTPQPLRLALARSLPPLRPAVFHRLIDETARANATYSFTAAMAESVPVVGVPLNLADMVVLTKNQLLMGYKIALGCGKAGRPRDVVGEVLGVVGAGFLFRQAARSLVGLIPVAGVLPKVAIAYTGTWAIGRAVMVWAMEGRKASPATMRRLSREAGDRGRAFARRLAAVRPRPAM